MQLELKKEDYSQLVRDGHYTPHDDLSQGRLDHVRRVWENQLTRFAIRPALVRLLERRGPQGLRLLDMGCGNGEGWQLLTRISASRDEAEGLLDPARIDSYLGVDLCQEMVNQGRVRLAAYPQARFVQADLGHPEKFMQPADLYFSSFGSPSHLEDAQLERLCEAIGRQAPPGAVVVLDLLGQFSLEWPEYWGYSQQPDQPRMQPYNMIWIYPENLQEQRRTDFADYRLRFWGGEEVESFLRRVPALGPRLARVERYDRSIFVGRHLDTGDFNPQARPTRRGVNSLFEFNRVTDPSELVVGPLPHGSLPFLEAYRRTWNALISVFERMSRGQRPHEALSNLEGGLELPPALQEGLQCLADQAQSGSHWLQPGLPIGNSLEPTFGLLLRQTEYHLQQGLGCGHGLMVVLELD